MTAALFSVFFCLIPKHFSLIYWSVCELIFHLHFGCSGAVHLTVRKPVDILYIYVYTHTYFTAYLDYHKVNATVFSALKEISYRSETWKLATGSNKSLTPGAFFLIDLLC